MGAEARRNSGRRFPDKPPAPIVNIAQARSKREALQEGRKPSVFIAVPSVSGRVNFTIAITFARAMASNAVPECPMRFGVHVEPGKRGPDYARNCIVRTFIEETDSDWLLMVDDDQAVPDNFWQLCTVTDADVVSGVTRVWVGNMDPETMLRVNHYGVDGAGRCFNLQAPPDEVKQPYRVPVVGTGCIAIRRRVFAPPPKGLGMEPFFFTHESNRKVKAGEDVNFSVNCNRAGFVIAVHPGVVFDHLKELPLNQIEQYYQARKAMESAGREPTEAQRLSLG